MPVQQPPFQFGFAWQAPRQTDHSRPFHAIGLYRFACKLGMPSVHDASQLEVTSSAWSPSRVTSYGIPSVGGFHAAKPAPRHHLAVLVGPRHRLACCMRGLAPEGQVFLPQANMPPPRTSAGCPVQAAPYLPCVAPHSTNSCQTKTTGYLSRALPSWRTLVSQDPATSSENGASSAQPTCMPLRPWPAWRRAWSIFHVMIHAGIHPQQGDFGL